MIGRPFLAALAASAALTLLAATPPPKPAEPPIANALTRAQMEALAPKVPLRTVYVVATNKLGQVTNAKSKTLSKNAAYNVQTYGNALQAFIRTEDGHAISGLYTLTYTYDPADKRITRTVALVHAGGVDPDAEGAALVMEDAARKEAAEAAAKSKHGAPAPHASAAHP